MSRTIIVASLAAALLTIAGCGRDEAMNKEREAAAKAAEAATQAPKQDAQKPTTSPAAEKPPEPTMPEEPQAQINDPAILAIDKFIADSNVNKSSPGWKTSLKKPPMQRDWDGSKTYVWTLKTNKGTMKFRLLPGVAPMHVTSVAYLTRLGFYDGLLFHRIIQGFMAQGGDPLGNGTGNPGYQFDHEFGPPKHTKAGMLSTANTGRPNTDGSQFFLTFAPTPWLDNKHTIFGDILEGEDVLKLLEEAAYPGDKSGRTRETVKIEKATISVVSAKAQ
jgi:peptidyl-prolyl cis-trans isomerase B (cyclophilin B)